MPNSPATTKTKNNNPPTFNIIITDKTICQTEITKPRKTTFLNLISPFTLADPENTSAIIHNECTSHSFLSKDESFNELSCNNSLYEFHDVDNDKSISTTNKNIIAFLNTSKNTYYTQEQTIAFSFDHEKKEKSKTSTSKSSEKKEEPPKEKSKTSTSKSISDEKKNIVEAVVDAAKEKSHTSTSKSSSNKFKKFIRSIWNKYG